jgi:hypothetical protein
MLSSSTVSASSNLRSADPTYARPILTDPFFTPTRVGVYNPGLGVGPLQEIFRPDWDREAAPTYPRRGNLKV